MIQLEPGKNYAIISISEFLAVSCLEFVSMERMQNGMNITKQLLFGKKSKLQTVMRIKDQLVFEGTELPFTTDYTAFQAGHRNSYTADACFNLVGKGPIEDIRRFIGEYNINPKADLGKIYFMDVPVFPELCEDFLEVSALAAGV